MTRRKPKNIMDGGTGWPPDDRPADPDPQASPRLRAKLAELEDVRAKLAATGLTAPTAEEREAALERMLRDSPAAQAVIAKLVPPPKKRKSRAWYTREESQAPARGIHAFRHFRAIGYEDGTYELACAFCDFIPEYQHAEGRGGCAALGRASKTKAAIRAHVLANHPDQIKET